MFVWVLLLLMFARLALLVLVLVLLLLVASEGGRPATRIAAATVAVVASPLRVEGASGLEFRPRFPPPTAKP